VNNISVTIPVGQALSRVNAVLFRPFDLGKWFVIGFTAWLAYLGESGGFGGGGNFGNWNGRHGQSARGALEQLRTFIVDNLAWLVPVAIVVILILLVIGLAVLWLSSRGRFMFLHCVALNTGEVVVPWERYGREANSLFLFRLVVALISMVVFLPLAGGVGLVILRMIYRGSFSVSGIIAVVFLVMAMILLGIVFWIIARLTKDFIVPLQFIRRIGCLAAWQELRRMLPGNLGNFILYLLFRIVLGMGMSLLVIVVVLATCCLAGCLMAIPYIGTVLLLPILVFDRSYSAYFLAQFGPDFDVFYPGRPA
jgi:hypothetical protein